MESRSNELTRRRKAGTAMNSPSQHPTIAVGVDESPEAMTAARFAVQEARTRGMSLLLVHADDYPAQYTPYVVNYDNDVRAQSQATVDSFVHELDVPRGVPVEILLEPSAPGIALIEVSSRVEEIVVGHHHAGWGERLLQGSVASAVAARASCPVVVVPHDWPSDAGATDPVVVTVDGSSAASAALRYGFDRADRTGLGLEVVHCAEVSDRRRVVDERTAALAEIVAGWQEEYPSVSYTTTQVFEDTVPGIESLTKRASLLVVGQPHSRHHLAPWLTSVAQTVLKRAHSPLAVVPRDLVEGPSPMSKGRATSTRA